MSRSGRVGTHTRGNSLVEYAIPLSIFFVAGIAAVVLTDVDERIVEFFANTTNGDHTGATVAVQRYGANVDMSKLPASHFIADVGNAAPGTTVPVQQVCLSDGLCLDMPIFSPGTVTETTGGLGGEEIHAMALVLEALAKEMEEDGVDPDLIGHIIALAQDGHGIGNEYTQLSGNCSYSSPCDRTISALDYSVGANGGTIPHYPLSPLNSARSKFKNSYKMLMQKNEELGDLLSQYPETKAVIDFEYDQINKLSTPDSKSSGYSITLTNNAEPIHQSADIVCGTSGSGECMYTSTDNGSGFGF